MRIPSFKMYTCTCMSGVAVSVAQGLINRLEKEGYVRVPMKNKRSVENH